MKLHHWTHYAILACQVPARVMKACGLERASYAASERIAALCELLAGVQCRHYWGKCSPATCPCGTWERVAAAPLPRQARTRSFATGWQACNAATPEERTHPRHTASGKPSDCTSGDLAGSCPQVTHMLEKAGMHAAAASCEDPPDRDRDWSRR